MKSLALLVLLMSTVCYAGVDYAKYANSSPIEHAFNWGHAEVYKITPATSTDPFASKTNKYAEVDAVAIISTGKGFHAKWSSAGTAASTSDFYFAPDTMYVFRSDTPKKYLRIIQADASATVWVAELK